MEMSLANVDASTGSAGTSMYSEIGATPVIVTSISSIRRDEVGSCLSVAAPGGLPITPCMKCDPNCSGRL
jgi:hypothetical protein